MRRPDPVFFPIGSPKTQVIFASGQLQGERENQEDAFANFNDECFIVADGLGGLPHGEVASKLAVETAIWGYKHIRLRPFYWRDKKLLIKRIFRSVNISVWQKQRETDFTDGMATTLLVAIVGPRALWVGSVGDSSAFLFQKGKLVKLTKEDVDEFGDLTKVIGLKRFGLIPQSVSLSFTEGATLFLATDGVTNYVTQEELRKILSDAGETEQSLKRAVVELFQTARDHGSTDNLTAYLIKRILYPEK